MFGVGLLIFASPAAAVEFEGEDGIVLAPSIGRGIQGGFHFTEGLNAWYAFPVAQSWSVGGVVARVPVPTGDPAIDLSTSAAVAAGVHAMLQQEAMMEPSRNAGSATFRFNYNATAPSSDPGLNLVATIQGDAGKSIDIYHGPLGLVDIYCNHRPHCQSLVNATHDFLVDSLIDAAEIESTATNLDNDILSEEATLGYSLNPDQAADAFQRLDRLADSTDVLKHVLRSAYRFTDSVTTPAGDQWLFAPWLESLDAVEAGGWGVADEADDRQRSLQERVQRASDFETNKFVHDSAEAAQDVSESSRTIAYTALGVSILAVLLEASRLLGWGKPARVVVESGPLDERQSKP